jgi:hypothetical protein
MVQAHRRKLQSVEATKKRRAGSELHGICKELGSGKFGVDSFKP